MKNKQIKLLFPIIASKKEILTYRIAARECDVSLQ